MLIRRGEPGDRKKAPHLLRRAPDTEALMEKALKLRAGAGGSG